MAPMGILLICIRRGLLWACLLYFLEWRLVLFAAV